MGMESKVRKTSTARSPYLTPSNGGHRFMAGMFDLSVLILGSVIIMVPSLIVFIGAMRQPSISRTIALYVMMFLTGSLVAIYDVAYRVVVPYFFRGSRWDSNSSGCGSTKKTVPKCASQPFA
jgi:hypothetical protein